MFGRIERLKQAPQSKVPMRSVDGRWEHATFVFAPPEPKVTRRAGGELAGGRMSGVVKLGKVFAISPNAGDALCYGERGVAVYCKAVLEWLGATLVSERPSSRRSDRVAAVHVCGGIECSCR